MGAILGAGAGLVAGTAGGRIVVKTVGMGALDAAKFGEQRSKIMAEQILETSGRHEYVPYFKEKGKFPGILGWILSTDHKRIGILYLVLVMSFFTWAVIIGVLMRINMIPGLKIMSAQQYNAMFTLHGVIQVFLVVIPAVPTIFRKFLFADLIGTKDMAFPRLNLFTWYLYLTGAILVFISIFTAGGSIDTGWTFYVPFSLKTSVNVPLATFAVFVLGMSSILTGINIVTTVVQLRAPGMGFFKMPLSVWGFFATAWVQILATPIIGITMVLIIMERLFGIGVFDPTKGESSPVPASFLDLFSPGGLYNDSSGNGCYL